MEKKGATAQRAVKQSILTAEQKYKVTITNESNQAWTFLVYQEPPANAQSLAWLASSYKIENDGGYIKFEWGIDYQFVWADTGELLPGVNFEAGGHKDCEPSNNNVTTFTVENNTPHLTPSKPGGDDGYLTIHNDRNVPANTYSVGVAMSKKGVFAVNAGPSLTHTFKPTPNYWVGAMNDVQEGDVMDIKTITQRAQLQFPPNIYHLSATLNKQNEWEIK